MNEPTELIQLGLKASLRERLQAEADRRGLPLRTLMRSILTERMNEQDAVRHTKPLLGPKPVVPPPPDAS